MSEFIRNSATLGKYVSESSRKFQAIFFFCCNRFHHRRVFQRGMVGANRRKGLENKENRRWYDKDGRIKKRNNCWI